MSRSKSAKISTSTKKPVIEKKRSFSVIGTRSRSRSTPTTSPTDIQQTQRFNVVEARIYTKGERNDYHYSPVPEIKIIPRFQVRVDPPDNIPYTMNLEEQEEEHPNAMGGSVIHSSAVITPPASPKSAQSGFQKPQLKIDTTAINHTESWTTAPPSPPSSICSPVALNLQSPTRAPPSPPTLTLSPILRASDDILINIFSNLDSLSSMSSLARTHSRFHDVLEPNKLYVLRGIMSSVSTPAYDLLELLRNTDRSTAKSYIEDYIFNLEVVSALKALIQLRCRYFLNSGKMDFHNQGAEQEFDDALYNIWTFCIVFKGRVGEKYLERQAEWWRRKNMSMRELMDVLEIWGCLGVLLRPFMDAPELARRHGVIENRPMSSTYVTEVMIELEQWISYLQTQGLDTIKLIVESPETDHNKRYAIVIAKGLNQWRKKGHHKKPHVMFLKDSVSRVYKELSLVQNVPTFIGGSWGPTTDV
ncbi:hypothetical protein DFP73DRAFT_471494 [Morchella snyderi]|nr:hypothetical protein DFP73DRAFT_471494 [Morchella snyderi]